MKVVVGLWRLLRGVALLLAAIVIFIEEWGWRPLAAMAARLATWPPVARLEARIVAAPPRLALLLFLTPATLLFPLKIAALWFIDKGRPEFGIFLIVLAKSLGTAFVGRLFILLESQLMSFAWFARAVRWWQKTKATVHGAVRASALWRRARAARLAWRLWLARITH
ncbi:MAG: hypothetical protein ABI330_16685 [Caldimonas sp.]